MILQEACFEPSRVGHSPRLLHSIRSKPRVAPPPPLMVVRLAVCLARFVKMRVPQWREDVLGWAAKQGYKETGGGVWGELDGENAEDVTRPTRYFVLTVGDKNRLHVEVLGWYLSLLCSHDAKQANWLPE